MTPPDALPGALEGARGAPTSGGSGPPGGRPGDAPRVVFLPDWLGNLWCRWRHRRSWATLRVAYPGSLLYRAHRCVLCHRLHVEPRKATAAR